MIIAKLIQNSLDECRFPSQWKKGHVFPLYKGKGAKQDSINYRPIPMTCCLSKTAGQIVNKYLLKHQVDGNFPTPAQSGFTKSDNTVFQLISIVHDTLANFANRKSTRSILLDIAKAFDRV